MTHKRYEDYINSGEAWLGSYPGHWHKKPLWTLFRRVKRQGFEDEELLSVYRDHGVIPKSSREDNFNKPSDDLGAYQLVEAGDLAVNKMKAWQGSVAISEYRGIVSPAYHVYAPLHSEHPRFFHYLMRCDRYITGYLSVSKGIRVNQWDLQPEYHSRMPILVPPFEEQLAIATFLDRETAKIDALIAEQQRLIELLQEKRQAVTSHTVTKGLNPDAPMKDSGVEWLGEVPEHWEIKPLKRMAHIENSGCYGEEESESGINLPVATTAQIDANGKFIVNKMPVRSFTPEEVARYSCKSNDILIVKSSGSASNIISGKAGLVDDGCEQFVFSNFLLRVRPFKDHSAKYIYFLLRSGLTRSRVEKMCSTTTYPNLQVGLYCSAHLPVPPLEEQHEIAHHITNCLAAVDDLVDHAQNLIDLMQERRSALITAAATGQIDVRRSD